jgi:hypothetical protein
MAAVLNSSSLFMLPTQSTLLMIKM